MKHQTSLTWTAAIVFAVLVGVPTGCSQDEVGPDPATAEFVGRSVCAQCHETQTQDWTGSHHDLAMQEATEQTVRGDFGDAVFSHQGVTSRFFRDGERFMVRTDGPTGELEDYAVEYTFGVEPLQQYLIAFPGGRLQTLGISWDARPSEQGGQRWFHVYPDEAIPHDDPLHWTGRNQNWNYMCASCHSTNLAKNYDVVADSYDTTWSEIDVSCESCHGPASHHVAWAEADGASGGVKKGLLFDLRNRSVWGFAEDGVTATRQGDPPVGDQVQQCAPCHARRSSMSEDYAGNRVLLDGHRLALLEPHLYFPDGQIKDEVYVYGSFVQSKMHKMGVTCTDCHEPHSLKLLAEGNALCLRCHQATAYDVPAHHHHESESPGSSCVECHMPERDYMVVDPRRDHSIRIPRPDLSDALDSPNACGSCHGDQTSAWAADAVVAWFGPDRAPAGHFGEALHAGREALPGAPAKLAQLARDAETPSIARATALALLESAPGPVALDAIVATIADGDPLVRLGALFALEGMPPDQRDRYGTDLLRDPVRAVRAEAARILAPVQKLEWSQVRRSEFEAAFGEYEAHQLLNADQPWAHVNLGIVHMQLSRGEEAKRDFETALRLDPSWDVAYVNLADLHRQNGNEDLCESVLRAGLQQNPASGELQHAIGLALVRQEDLPRALAYLQRAMQLRQDVPRFSFTYGLALNAAGEPVEAIAVLARAQERHPRDLDLLYTLATICRDVGRLPEARLWAQKLLGVAPENESFRQLVDELNR